MQTLQQHRLSATTETQRYAEIDVFGVLAAVFVMFIHISSSAITTLDTSGIGYMAVYFPWRASMAAIQAFIFISGVKFTLSYIKEEKPSYLRWLGSRAVKLLPAFVIANFVYYAVYIYIGRIARYRPSEFIYSFFTGTMEAQLYFVPLIFQFYILAPLWRFVLQKLSAKVALPAALAVTLAWNEIAIPILRTLNADINIFGHLFLGYIFFFTAGLYAGRYYDIFKFYVYRYKKVIVITFFLILSTYCTLFYLGSRSIIKLYFTQSLHSLYSACFIGALFLLSCFAARFHRSSKTADIIKSLSISSYYIYIWHCLFIVLLDRAASNINALGTLDTWLVKLLVIPAATIGVCYAYVLMKRRVVRMAKRENILVHSVSGLLKFVFNRLFIVCILLILQFFLIFFMIWRFRQYFIYFYYVSLLLSFALTIIIINKRENPSYKIAWIVPIVFIPIFGVTLYFIFAGNRMTSRQQKKLERITASMKESLSKSPDCSEVIDSLDPRARTYTSYISNHAFCPPYTGCSVKYFRLGDDLLPVLLAELEKAEKYIFLEYFIIAPGSMWNAILDVLKRKAQNGVDVRIIYDDIGTILLLPSNFAKKLRSYNIKVEVWNPFKPVLSAHQNNRDHRKIAVIDGIVAFTGGINIADEYINVKEIHGHWKDSAVMIKGEAAWSMTVMFLSLWDYIVYGSTVTESYESYKPRTIPADRGEGAQPAAIVQPYTDNPLDGELVGENIYLNLINRASKYVWITTPYLIIDNELVTALSLAAKSGIDVRLITPYVGDKRFVHSTTRSFYLQLIDAGVRIYEYTPGFIHAKSFVSDDCFATVGSVNLDFRSLYLHFECGALICDYNADGVIGDIKSDFLLTLEQSREITKADCKVSWLTRVIRAIMVAFAPLM